MAWDVPAGGLSVLPLWSDVVHKLAENGKSLDYLCFQIVGFW